MVRAPAATYRTTPATYISERRVERAQDLLRTTNLTVTEVCNAVGFSSLGSFSSRFRDLVGETPSAFQARYAASGAPSAPRLLRMITNVSLVSVWVKDIDESLAFYTDVLGFEPGDDIRMGEDFRWTTVFHPKQPELHLHLTTPSKPLSDDLIAAMRRAQDEGGLPGVGVHVDDCWATYEELKAKGVEFLQEPEERPYGVEALMRDNSGNWMVIVEPRAYKPEDFDENS